MKQLILFFACALAFLFVDAQVPTGAYANKRGVVKAIVNTTGDLLYLVDSEGNVTNTYEIRDDHEVEDGIHQFTIYKSLGGSYAVNDNHNWWRYHNGKIELDLSVSSQVLTNIDR